MEIIDAAGLKVLSKGPFEIPTDEMNFDLVMLKTRSQLDLWNERLKMVKGPLDHIIELGIRHGGSIPYLYDLCDAKFIAGVDITPAHPPVVKLIESALGNNFALFHKTDQTDAKALNNIVRNHFKNGLDMVVDDASHYLYETRRSFEILFPKLRTDGIYVIEDHRWGHINAFKDKAPAHFLNKPSMLQIIFEIAMFLATTPDAIGTITMDENTITITRGEAKIKEPFFLTSSTTNWAGLDFNTLMKSVERQK